MLYDLGLLTFGSAHAIELLRGELIALESDKKSHVRGNGAQCEVSVRNSKLSLSYTNDIFSSVPLLTDTKSFLQLKKLVFYDLKFVFNS